MKGKSFKNCILAQLGITHSHQLLKLLVFLFGLALLAFPLSGCQKRPEEVKIPPYEGLEVTLVEAKEPHLPGAPSYQDSIQEFIKEFEARKKVKVNVVFLERKEIRDLLAKGGIDGKPGLAVDVVYSGEWPFCPESENDLSPGIAKGEYLELSLSYWTKDGKTLGVPSFINWFSLAFKKDALSLRPSQSMGEEQNPDMKEDARLVSIPQDLRGKVGYWPDTMAFYRTALDGDFAEPEKIKEYFMQVKEQCGLLVENPLEAWEDGSVKALYPVNPYLLRWIMVSMGKDGGMGFQPIMSFYTVPGYVVLSSEEPARSLAQELAVAAARHKGRWAARAIGGIPARVQDVTTFHLESGFNYEERQAIFKLTQSPFLTIPDAKENAWMEAIIISLTEPAEKYLSDQLKDDQLEKSILQVLKDHTKP